MKTTTEKLLKTIINFYKARGEFPMSGYSLKDFFDLEESSEEINEFIDEEMSK